MYAERNSKNIGYPSQLAIFLGLAGAALVLGSIVTVAVWKMMTGQPILSMEKDMADPKYYTTIMVIQGLSTFLIFFLPAYVFAMICYNKASQYIGFNLRFNAGQILLLVGILVLTFPLSGALAELNKIIPISESLAKKFKAYEADRVIMEAALIKIDSFYKYALSLLIIAILPAIFEETLFRGGLQNFLTRWFKGPWIAIIITSIIFSLIHMSFYGFLVRFALGVVLGLIYYYSRNLWLSILFHFLFNGVQVTVLYVINVSGSKMKPDIEQRFPIWMGLIAVVFLVFLFIQFRRRSQTVLDKYPDDDVVIEDEDDFLRWTKS